MNTVQFADNTLQYRTVLLFTVEYSIFIQKCTVQFIVSPVQYNTLCHTVLYHTTQHICVQCDATQSH